MDAGWWLYSLGKVREASLRRCLGARLVRYMGESWLLCSDYVPGRGFSPDLLLHPPTNLVAQVRNLGVLMYPFADPSPPQTIDLSFLGPKHAIANKTAR